MKVCAASAQRITAVTGCMSAWELLAKHQRPSTLNLILIIPSTSTKAIYLPRGIVMGILSAVCTEDNLRAYINQTNNCY